MGYAAVVFVNPDSVVSSPSQPAVSAPEDGSVQPQAPAEEDFFVPVSASAARFESISSEVSDRREDSLPDGDPSEVYISSSHAHLLDEVKQSLSAKTSPSSGSSASAAAAGISSSSVSGGGGGGGGGSAPSAPSGSTPPTPTSTTPAGGSLGAGTPTTQIEDTFLADLSDMSTLTADMNFSFPGTHLGKGKTYYVSPSGDDWNVGTSLEYPFRTIQKALKTSTGGSSDAYDVIIVTPGKYIVDPITINLNNIELVFQDGVELEAKPIELNTNSILYGKQGFENPNASLISMYRVNNVIIRGYGTILRMEKAKYMTLPDEYRKEFRCGVKIVSSRNITVSGLVICDTGGDGVYIGATVDNDEFSFSQNITLQNTVVDSAYRNAVGIISVDGLLIENCVLRNTRGTLPECGLKCEPNAASQRLKNIVVRNVTLSNNNESAMYIQADQLKGEYGPSTSEPIDMLFENLYVKNDKGIKILRFFENRPEITVIFRNLIMVDTFWGLQLYVSAQQADITLENCIWSGIVSQPPVFIYSMENQDSGGITFRDCQIFDNQKRPSILFSSKPERTLRNVRGTVYVENDQQYSPLFETRGSNLVNVDVNIADGIANFVPAGYSFY